MKEIKKAVEVFIKVAEYTEKSLEDGKISFAEGIGFIPKALGFLKVIKNAKGIWLEYLALTDEQKDELNAYFVKELDFSNDAIEHIIEQVFAALMQLSDVFENVNYVE